MLRLLGIPVSDDDARRLIAILLVEGTPDALAAAAMIAKGVERNLYAVGLSPGERAAVRACLEDLPDGLVVELRGVLMREHRSCDEIDSGGRERLSLPRKLSRSTR